MASYRRSIVWLRRDLRLADNVALARAAQASAQVVCAFVLDPELLHSDRVGAPIVSSFFEALGELREALRTRGSDLALLEGDFAVALQALAKRIEADALFFNVDYDPVAIARDERVVTELRGAGLATHAFVDHVYFGADDVLQKSGQPYTVYTPYRRRWLERQAADPRPPVDSAAAIEGRLVPAEAIGATRAVPVPADFGHAASPDFPHSGETRAAAILTEFLTKRGGAYEHERNFPGRPGTSHLSPQLRAGTIGIRTCVFRTLEARDAAPGGERLGYDTWLSELIWRDFYQAVLKNFPHVATEPFIPAAKSLSYRESEADYRAWETGATGYPIVDAAMRQIKRYGWMHNRLRMIVASFLTKDLVLDYRLGEAYFERALADADKAANNGGWQWSASTGTDAAPYFRVFNPILQSRKFDPSGDFIREMIPELAGVSTGAIHEPWTLSPLEQETFGVRIGREYPAPIVAHDVARARALAVYAPVLGSRAPVKT